MARVQKHKIVRLFYRNGQLREESPLLDGQFHGAYRTWHPNGKLATEELYEHGQLHGVCRQWNDAGKLLGSFTMTHGTGIRREWFPDGQLQSEASKVNDLFTGRMCSWLRDGTLAAQSYLIENRQVSRAKYIAATRRHPEYPRYPAGRERLRGEKELYKRELKLHLKWLLSRSNKSEARKWLEAPAQQRSLGLLNFRQAQRLVENLYVAGAEQILIANIYHGKSGKEFSDALVIKMPLQPRARRLVRQLLIQFPKKLRAAVLPEMDDKLGYAFASFE